MSAASQNFEPEKSSQDEIWTHYPNREDENEQSPYFAKAKSRMEEVLKKKARQEWREKRDKTFLEFEFVNPSKDLPVCIAQGGAGGLGNPNFITAEDRTPYYATRGENGQERHYELTLKTIAQVGLVGMPNAGKSTLLTAISNAKSRVADFEFTTLFPHIGNVSLGGPEDLRLSIADIPGLIEGAADNRGLGIEFLRHVERAEVLMIVLDLSRPNPIADLEILRNEMASFNPDLIDRTRIIIGNKADLPGTEQKMDDLIASERERPGVQPLLVPLSAIMPDEAVDNIVQVLSSIVYKSKE